MNPYGIHMIVSEKKITMGARLYTQNTKVSDINPRLFLFVITL